MRCPTCLLLQLCSVRRRRMAKTAKTPYATPDSRADGGVPPTAREPRGAGTALPGTLRRFGSDQVVARSVVRGGEPSLPCPITGGRAARQVPKGWRARCRETRRGCSTRRQGNTRPRAMPHPGTGCERPGRASGRPLELNQPRTAPGRWMPHGAGPDQGGPSR